MAMTEETTERGKRKGQIGIVVSDVMEKTVVVEIRNAAAHSTYGKIVRLNKRLKAHDETNEAGVGDSVRIMIPIWPFRLPLSVVSSVIAIAYPSVPASMPASSRSRRIPLMRATSLFNSPRRL